MSPSKNLEIDAIFIKGLRKKRNFRRMIEEKSVISVKRWRKRLDFHQKRYFYQKIPKKMLFQSKDRKNDTIFVKRSRKRVDFSQRIAKKIVISV